MVFFGALPLIRGGIPDVKGGFGRHVSRRHMKKINIPRRSDIENSDPRPPSSGGGWVETRAVGDLGGGHTPVKSLPEYHSTGRSYGGSKIKSRPPRLAGGCVKVLSPYSDIQLLHTHNTDSCWSKYMQPSKLKRPVAGQVTRNAV